MDDLSLVTIVGSGIATVAAFAVQGVQRRRLCIAFDRHFAAMGKRMGFRLLSAPGKPGSHARHNVGLAISKWAVLTGDNLASALPGAGMFRTPANTALAFAGTKEGLLLQALTNPSHVAITCYFGERLRLINPISHTPSGIFLLSPRRYESALLIIGDAVFDGRFLVSVAGLSHPLRGTLPLPAEVRDAAMAVPGEAELTLMYDGVSAVVTVSHNPDDETFRRLLRLLEAFESFVPDLLDWRAKHFEHSDRPSPTPPATPDDSSRAW